MRRIPVILTVAIAVGAHVVSISPASGEPVIDSTALLQAQLDALKPGGYLKLNPQIYRHSGVIRLRVPDVHIDGGGATLQATDDATSSVQIAADGVSLSNLTLTAPPEGKRWAGRDQQKLVVSGSRSSLSHLSIVGSAAAGIFVDGAQEFSITDVSITGSRADGIHMTGGSRNGVVDNVRTVQTGDDAVAVVSYASDGASSSDIRITNVAVASTRSGRGITVVGGQNVSIRDFSVSNTAAAGIYVATEGDPFYTDSVTGVQVAGGALSSANRDPGVVQGAVLVYAGNAGTRVQDVQVSDVSISATPESAARNVGIVVDDGTVGGVAFNGIRINNSAVTPFFTNAPAGDFSTSGWTLDGNPTTVD